MQQRIKKVREIIISQKLDAMLVTGQYNVSYLTGFAGLSPNEREGYLFITKTSARLLTYSTYYEMYKSGGDGFDSVCITLDKRLHHHLSEIIDKEKIKQLYLSGISIEGVEEHPSLLLKAKKQKS